MALRPRHPAALLLAALGRLAAQGPRAAQGPPPPALRCPPTPTDGYRASRARTAEKFGARAKDARDVTRARGERERARALLVDRGDRRAAVEQQRVSAALASKEISMDEIALCAGLVGEGSFGRVRRGVRDDRCGAGLFRARTLGNVDGHKFLEATANISCCPFWRSRQAFFALFLASTPPRWKRAPKVQSFFSKRAISRFSFSTARRASSISICC